NYRRTGGGFRPTSGAVVDLPPNHRPRHPYRSARCRAKNATFHGNGLVVPCCGTHSTPCRPAICDIEGGVGTTLVGVGRLNTSPPGPLSFRRGGEGYSQGRYVRV